MIFTHFCATVNYPNLLLFNFNNAVVLKLSDPILVPDC